VNDKSSLLCFRPSDTRSTMYHRLADLLQKHRNDPWNWRGRHSPAVSLAGSDFVT